MPAKGTPERESQNLPDFGVGEDGYIDVEMVKPEPDREPPSEESSEQAVQQAPAEKPAEKPKAPAPVEKPAEKKSTKIPRAKLEANLWNAGRAVGLNSDEVVAELRQHFGDLVGDAEADNPIKQLTDDQVLGAIETIGGMKK